MTAITYEGYEKLIYKETYRFVRRGGHDWNDVHQEAVAAYCEARDRYDPERGTAFTTYATSFIRGRLLHAFCNTRWARRHNAELEIDFETLNGRRAFNLDVLLGEVSEDAADVIRLALACNRAGFRSKRRALINFLADLGWAGKRIAESFMEIKEALQT